MTLTNAQLMSPPSPAAILGAVKAGTGIYISPEGVISSTGATGGFPQGTTMSFYQPTAPLYWVQLTSEEFSDATIRIVTTFGGASGNNQPFSTVFANYTPTGTIDVSQLRTGSSPVSGSIDSSSLNTGQMPSHQHLFGGQKPFQYQPAGAAGAINGFGQPWSNTGDTNANGGNQGHSHGFNLVASSGTITGSASFQGQAKSFAVKYLDFIVARAS